MKKAVNDTTDDLDKFKSQANDKFQNIDDQLSNIQNDVNGNKQKIEDANGIIKRHTEQLIELEPEINDLKHEMSELDRVKGIVISKVIIQGSQGLSSHFEMALTGRKKSSNVKTNGRL